MSNASRAWQMGREAAMCSSSRKPPKTASAKWQEEYWQGHAAGKVEANPVAPVVAQLVDVLDLAAKTHGEEIRQVILEDLAAGRHGWYHEMVLCYIELDDIEKYGRLAAIRAANQLHITLPKECFA